MSVDKFGRSIHVGRSRVMRGPPGIGFKLTTSRDYDIENKRLKNVYYPIEEFDACTKKYADELLNKTLVLNSKYNVYQAFGARISNVAEPIAADDVCSKKYLDNSLELYRENMLNSTLSLHNNNDYFDAEMMRISHLALPQSANDAVPKCYVEEATKKLNGKIISLEVKIDSKISTCDTGRKTCINNKTDDLIRRISSLEDKILNLKNKNKPQQDFMKHNIVSEISTHPENITSTVDNSDSDLTDRAFGTQLEQ